MVGGYANNNGYELLEKYKNVFLECARKIVRNDKGLIAGDVANEAYIKAYENIDKFKGPEKDFPKWIYRIVQNTFYDECRAKKRRPSSSNNYSIDELEHLLLDEQNEEREHLITLMLECVGHLPSDVKTLVDLIYLQKHTHKEASLITGIPLKRIAMKLRRAKIALKEAMEKRIDTINQ